MPPDFVFWFLATVSLCLPVALALWILAPLVPWPALPEWVGRYIHRKERDKDT